MTLEKVEGTAIEVYSINTVLQIVNIKEYNN
jgi:hypothetical protein